MKYERNLKLKQENPEKLKEIRQRQYQSCKSRHPPIQCDCGSLITILRLSDKTKYEKTKKHLDAITSQN